MSTQIKSHTPELDLTKFWGGEVQGPMLQITVHSYHERFPHISITKAQAASLAADLLDFAQNREEVVY